MKFKKTFSKALTLIMCLSLVVAAPSKTAKANSLKVVTLGADLTENQKESMLKYFDVTKKEASIIYVTNDEEFKYLGKVATKEQIGSKAISCSYIEPTNTGGLKISINNIHWVTENMIKNSLITAGIENAKVVVGSPFNVSGTAALTGILKGFENSSAGEKIDEEKKEAANEELVVTGNLGEKIGQDEAAGLINEIKKEVVKESPKSEKDIKKIVEKTASSYSDIKDKLSDEDIEKITALMDKINNLDLDFSKIKDQLNDVSNLLKEKLGSEEAQSFFSKIGEFLRSIGEFFARLFS